MRSLTNHYQVFKIHLIEVMLFRLRALVWFLVGSINTAILLLFWWATINANNQSSFSIPAITTYYVLLFTLATSTICHIEEDIAFKDIYKGNLYAYLLKPYSYLQRKFYEEIVWRLMGGFWAVLILIVLTSLGLPLAISSQPSFWILTAFSAFLGMLVSFYFKSILGLSSIWLTNIGGVLDLFEIVNIVLGGFVLPIHLLPSPLKEVGLFSPFAMSVYYPVHILTNQPNTAELVRIFGLQVFWILLLFVITKIIFKVGVKSYVGSGQ